VTAQIALALGIVLASAALMVALRAPAPPSRRACGLALLALAGGLAWARQYALALPVAALALGLLGSGAQAGAGRRAQPRPGGRSEVRSEALAMWLDHETGEMDGTVLTGALAGAHLSDLDAAALEELARAFEDDPDSLGLLLAYLERRGEAAGAEPPPAGDGTTMSEAEALRVLGLEPGADLEAVRAAHRRLMLKVHPDLGGSGALAALINAAKERLDP
jgi:hypothetical protein